MMISTERLFEKYYYSNPAFVDGTTTFHRLLNENIPKGSKILEIGAGSSNPTSAYLSSIGSLIAADVSNEVRLNASADFSVVFDGESLPFENASFDSCVSNYVIEHIAKPKIHFQEVSRVLKPGGIYCFRTPNLWHYVTFASWLLPHAVHRRAANWMRGLPTNAHDPYPTEYRANTERRLRKFCDHSHLRIRKTALVEAEPSYGRFHPAAFIPMMLYEKTVNRCLLLQRFRANIFCIAVKEG